MYGWLQLKQHRQKAQLPTREWWQQPWLKQIQLGTSFRPEHFSAHEHKIGLPLEVLRWIVEELGITQIRLGVRWNSVMQANEQINLEYYRPFLDYLLSRKDIAVCLNLGPIKTIGWPEEQIPYFLHSRMPIPAIHGKVSSLEPLAQFGLSYLTQLCELLRSEYGNKLKQIKVIQPDNEPFFRFGHYRWTIDPAYIIQSSQLLNDYFPNAEVMISSAGARNIDQIIDLAFKLSKDRIQTRLGLNYYYQYPGVPWLPGLGYADNLLEAPYFSAVGIGGIKQKFEQGKVSLEISEAQFEPWEKYTLPGSTTTELKYLAQRLIELKPHTQEHLLLRLWGLERLYFHRDTNTELTSLIQYLTHLH